jgi:CelD/BcsL family acetyltransferase involved in cellulose biosynthesis
LRIASPIGGKHANYHLPLMAADSLPSPSEVRALLREAEEWVRREGDERAECALERCRAAFASTTIAV